MKHLLDSILSLVIPPALGEITPRRCPDPAGTRLLASLLMTSLLVMFCTSCVRCTNPLSDPRKATPDSRLVGSWEFDAKDSSWFDLVPVGGKLPKSILTVRASRRSKDAKKDEASVLVYPTSIGDAAYLNIAAVKTDKFDKLREGGWDPMLTNGFLIVKYEVNGDSLTLWPMDFGVISEAIEKGKIKGTIAKKKEREKDERDVDVPAAAWAIGDVLDEPVRAVITDTSDNLRRFVASDNGLFVKEGLSLKRQSLVPAQNAAIPNKR